MAEMRRLRRASILRRSSYAQPHGRAVVGEHDDLGALGQARLGARRPAKDGRLEALDKQYLALQRAREGALGAGKGVQHQPGGQRLVGDAHPHRPVCRERKQTRACLLQSLPGPLVRVAGLADSTTASTFHREPTGSIKTRSTATIRGQTKAW